MQLVQLFSAEDGSNPLVAISRARSFASCRGSQNATAEVEKRGESHPDRGAASELVELRERHGGRARVAEEAERAGTRKGLTFEELVHAAIEEIAQARGDVAAHTGGEQAEGRRQEGRHARSIGRRLRRRVSGPDRVRGEEQAPLQERGVDRAQRLRWTTARGLVRRARRRRRRQRPVGLEELTEYEGNKIIAVLDREEPDPLALRLVYRLGRARVLAMARDRDLEVDAVAVRDTAAEAVSAAQAGAGDPRRNGLHQAPTRDEARAGDDSMEIALDVERCLARIDALVAERAAEAR